MKTAILTLAAVAALLGACDRYNDTNNRLPDSQRAPSGSVSPSTPSERSGTAGSSGTGSTTTPPTGSTGSGSSATPPASSSTSPSTGTYEGYGTGAGGSRSDDTSTTR